MNQRVQWCIHGCYISTDATVQPAGIHFQLNVKTEQCTERKWRNTGEYLSATVGEGASEVAHCGEVEIAWYQW